MQEYSPPAFESHQRFKALPVPRGVRPPRPSASSGCSAVSGCGQTTHQGVDPGATGAQAVLTILPEEFQTWVTSPGKRRGCGRGRKYTKGTRGTSATGE